jgi:hypothetical protein
MRKIIDTSPRETLINVWINNQQQGKQDTSPRETKKGMDKLPRRRKYRDLSEGKYSGHSNGVRLI